jgi:hypothetical protein
VTEVGPATVNLVVQGVGTPTLAVLDVDYDGQRLVASYIPPRDGTLTVHVTGLNEDLLAEQVTSGWTGHLNTSTSTSPASPGWWSPRPSPKPTAASPHASSGSGHQRASRSSTPDNPVGGGCSPNVCPRGKTAAV